MSESGQKEDDQAENTTYLREISFFLLVPHSRDIEPSFLVLQ
jgi:hypothetical protein